MWYDAKDTCKDWNARPRMERVFMIVDVHSRVGPRVHPCNARSILVVCVPLLERALYRWTTAIITATFLLFAFDHEIVKTVARSHGSRQGIAALQLYRIPEWGSSATLGQIHTVMLYNVVRKGLVANATINTVRRHIPARFLTRSSGVQKDPNCCLLKKKVGISAARTRMTGYSEAGINCTENYRGNTARCHWPVAGKQVFGHDN